MIWLTVWVCLRRITVWQIISFSRIDVKALWPRESWVPSKQMELLLSFLRCVLDLKKQKNNDILMTRASVGKKREQTKKRKEKKTKPAPRPFLSIWCRGAQACQRRSAVSVGELWWGFRLYYQALLLRPQIPSWHKSSSSEERRATLWDLLVWFPLVVHHMCDTRKNYNQAKHTWSHVRLYAGTCRQS